jgi:uncharacterized protein YmfQ (DUF2313 family)
VNIWQEVISAAAGLVAEDTADGTLDLLEKWEGFSCEDKTRMGAKARSCFEKKFAVDTAAKKMLQAVSY